MSDQDCTASQDNCQNSKTPVVDSRFKRPHSTPMLCTPYREEKRVPLRELVCTDTLVNVAARPISLFPQYFATVNSDSTSYYSKNALKVNLLSNYSYIILILVIGQMECRRTEGLNGICAFPYDRGEMANSQLRRVLEKCQ